MGVSGQVSQQGDIKSIPLRTHSLAQPYLDSDMQSRWWDFGGDTIVRTDKYIRLTADRPSRMGYVWSRVPLTATNWEVEIEFKIHGEGNLHGDGMAFWISKQRAQQGPVFGSVDKFEGLGIFIDTYKNNRPGTVWPYVMAMFGDGKTTYDKANDGKANEYGGCSARGIRGATVPTKMRVTYFQDKSLKVELQLKAEDQWVLCFEKENPPNIPSVAYLGFSAETGELHDNHDIISVQSRNLYFTSPGGLNRANNRDNLGSTSRMGKDSKYNSKNNKKPKSKPPRGQKAKGTWMGFFFKFFLFGAVLGGAYVGFTYYRIQNKKRSHRF